MMIYIKSVNGQLFKRVDVCKIKKMLKTIYFILISLFVLAGCCKIQPVPVIRLIYTDIEEEGEVQVIRTVIGDWSNHLDTLPEILRENSHGDYTIWLEVEKNQYDYIIQSDDLKYSDTITEVDFQTKGSGCRFRIKDFHYNHNGYFMTDTDLVIN